MCIRTVPELFVGWALAASGIADCHRPPGSARGLRPEDPLPHLHPPAALIHLRESLG
jgi:hypothetical protein